MNKKLKELLSTLGLLLAAFAMMAVAVGVVFLVSAVFHVHFK